MSQAYEIIIITAKHDSRMKLDKEKLKELLSQEYLEIVRVERVRRI